MLMFKFRRVRAITMRLLAKILLIVCLQVVVATLLLVLVFRWADPPISAFMLHTQAESGVVSLNYQWVDHDDIPLDVFAAVIASEDQRFLGHNGLDFDAIQDAVKDRIKGGKLRGASTISQQVARNMFLWPERSFVRKGLEAYFTMLIELLWPKQRIVEMYLNIAEFGPGIYGVQAASRHFFGKPASRLGLSEAALLAAVLPNPKELHVNAPTDYVRQRQAWIIDQARRLKRSGQLAQLQT
jgi:monofunctional biosynthetic peptidoglycan transglycosylase